MKKISNILYCIILITGVLVCITSCSTRKNTFPNRAYHTITSKYNVNFNGKEALKKGIEDIEKKQEDNYTMLLPIYYYPPKEKLSSALPSFDKTIEKASKAIYKHSMLIRGKEYVKTMDDAYLMMGKAFFYKQDYSQAQRYFFYIDAQYPDWGLREEAKILNARCALRQKYYSRAQTLLDEIYPYVQDKKSKKLNLLYDAAVVEYNLTAPDGDKEIAIEYLLDALKNRPKKDFRNRMHFILGQLYETIDEPKNAQQHFLAVIKSTPPYSMEFSARMHLASNYDGTKESKALIIKEFDKMLEEEKNNDYQDQIYYALSEISRIDENREERVDFLAKSVATSVNNNYQKTLSSITLADLFFEDNEYVTAQHYYDTALMALPKDYPNYNSIISKAATLKDLVDNLQVIELQDSLQRIAKMTPAQRDAWVKKMINKYTEEERRLAKEEADRMLLLQSTSSFANVNVNTSGSTEWYFYNPGLVSAGATEFYRRFGNRKLEDNWLVSNKQQISFDDMENMNSGADTIPQYDEDGNLIVQRETDPKKPAYYTQDLPMTPGAIDTSNALISIAMYNAGIIYYDQLLDYPRANEMLESLTTRFPQDTNALPSYYILYSSYGKLKNQSKSDENKNIILTRYPESDYAKLILDPQYYTKLLEKMKEFEKRYETTYDNYVNKRWANVVSEADQVIPNCADETLKSKFDYLRAVSIGQIHGEDTLKSALTQIITTYPGSGVAELAKIYLSNFANVSEILASVGDSTQTQQEGPAAPPANSPFKFNPNEQHYIVLIVNIHKHTVADIKSELSAFNREFFSLQKFNINSFYINQDEQLVTLSKFKNMEGAMSYYSVIVNDVNFGPKFASGDIKLYAMSAVNYTTYYNKTDKRSLYNDFFQYHYKPQGPAAIATPAAAPESVTPPKVNKTTSLPQRNVQPINKKGN